MKALRGPEDICAKSMTNIDLSPEKHKAEKSPKMYSKYSKVNT